MIEFKISFSELHVHIHIHNEPTQAVVDQLTGLSGEVRDAATDLKQALPKE